MKFIIALLKQIQHFLRFLDFSKKSQSSAETHLPHAVWTWNTLLCGIDLALHCQLLIVVLKTIFAKVFITVRQQTTQDHSKRWLLCFTLSLPFLYDSVGIGHIYAAGCLVVLLLFKKICTFSIQLFLLRLHGYIKEVENLTWKKLANFGIRGGRDKTRFKTYEPNSVRNSFYVFWLMIK